MPILFAAASNSSLDYWWVLVVRGVLSILFGLVALAWPQITVVALIALFAAFAFLDGVTSILSAIRHRHYGWSFLGGILSIIVGVIAVVWPASAGFALIMLVAAWAFTRGVFDIAAAITLRQTLESRAEWMLIVSGLVSVAFGLFVAFWPLAGVFAIVGVVAGFSIFLGATLLAAGLRQRLLRNRLVTHHI